jgi:hypothetical protein
MTETALFRQNLTNGLTLEFFDRSRPMAGDRWQVILEVRLPIPVTAATLPPDLRNRADEVIAALSQEIFFTKQEIRHFIDIREIPAVLQKIQTRLWEGLKNYVSHPDFAGLYIRKKFAELQGQPNRQRI